MLQPLGEKSGWDKVPANGGRGVAFPKSFGIRAAIVAEVSVDEGDFTVDCGVAINPDIVAAQIEGAVGFALSSLLRNKITRNNGQVQQSNFHNYEPTHMREIPKVEVHIVPSSEAPSGIGEPGVPPLAPVAGNAISAAPGKSMYNMPFHL